MMNTYLATESKGGGPDSPAGQPMVSAVTKETAEQEFFCHPKALVEDGVRVGRGSRIWAFAHLVSGAQIGADCNVCDQCFIEGEVRIGDRVTIKCGVSLWDGIIVENDVFIGPNACFTNDVRPRSKHYLAEYPRTVLREGCTVGANSTTLPGLTIGRWAMVGAGAVVTRDVPDYALVRGNPARLVGWVCQCGQKLPAAAKRRLVCSCGQIFEQVAGREIKRLIE